jgi:calcineurin-like phosphoesterase
MADVGMCGDPDGVIGFEKDSVIRKIVNGQSGAFQLNDEAPMMINACLIEIDEETYLPKSITPIHQIVER